MAANAKLDDALVQLGQAQADESAEVSRKRDIKAMVFGAPSEPRRIGRFIDLGVLGHGAMGTVRRAYDERLARAVAIKVVRNGAMPQHHGRLLREAQALAQLSHPNVVQIYEVGELGDEIFIAMELIDGVTLKQWHRDSRGWRDSVEAYIQAGRGLVAAHAVGLVHRDFKPANCIRDTTGRVRVLDFGLARAIDLVDVERSPSEDENEDEVEVGSGLVVSMAGGPNPSTQASGSLLQQPLTEDNSIVGTIAYMAPEQYAGRRVDAKSDQFSFCVALFEALYGELPFSTDPRRALLAMAGGKGAAPAFPEGAHTVPRSIRRVLQRGLAAEADERWPSMEALLRELERSLRGPWWRSLAMQAVVVGGTAVLMAALMGGEPVPALVEPEVTEPERLDGVWDEGARRAVRTALMEGEDPAAEHRWTVVERELDRYVDDWESLAVSYRDLDRSSNEWRCLELSRNSLGRVVDGLAGADRRMSERALGLLERLPVLEECRNPIGWASRHSVPDSPEQWQAFAQLHDKLQAAREMDAAGRYVTGLEFAEHVLSSARQTGDRLLEAQALIVEGELYRNDGRPDKAVDAFDAAAEIGWAEGYDEVVVDARGGLACVVGIEQGSPERGIQLLSDVIRLSERDTVDEQSRAKVLTSLGHIYSKTDHREAQRYYERARDLVVGIYGEEHLSLARIDDGLAGVLAKQGKREDALETRQRALDIHQRWYGEQHPRTAQTRVNIATLLIGAGKLDEARQALELALVVFDGTRAADHPDLGNAKYSLAYVLGELGEHARAQALYREAIGIWESRMDGPQERVFDARFGLALTLDTLNEESSAIEQYESIIDPIDQIASADRVPWMVPKAARAFRDLGMLYEGRGRLSEAERVYLDGLKWLEMSGGTHEPAGASMHMRLGRLAKAQGKRARAKQHFQRAYKSYAAIYPEDHRKVARARQMLESL